MVYSSDSDTTKAKTHRTNFRLIMTDNEKTQLTQEYIRKFKVFMMIPKMGAFNRFDVENGQIVSISRCSQLYAVIAMIIVTITGYTLILETSIHKNLLIQPEYITVIELGVLNNVVLLNLLLFNRHSGAELFKRCIEIDLFLGIKQTAFMRDIVAKDVLIWSIGIISFEIGLTTVLVVAFTIPTYTYFTGVIYFQMLFSLCFDHTIHVVLYKFLCLRVHYLNVGLVKMANLNTEYLKEHLLSYPFLWKKEDDDRVKLQRILVDVKYFTATFRMIDAQMYRIQNNYRFTIFACITSLVIGTFLAVQTVIIIIKNPDIPVIRTFSLTGWFVASWSIFIGITRQTDKLNMQIQRTKLICTYILLKPNNADELFHLSRSILDTLSVSDFRISIYNMFYFDQRLLGSIATSVFVFITMQLQLAFPKRSNSNKLNA